MALNPAHVASNNNLGRLLALEGNRSAAIECYRRALASDPNTAETHNNLGRLLEEEGRQTEAIEHLEKAVSLKPLIVTFRNLAFAYLKAGRQKDAVAVARRALELARSEGKTADVQEIEAWLKSQPPAP